MPVDWPPLSSPMTRILGELVFRQGQATSGVVLVRLAGFSNEAKARSVVAALQKHSVAMLGSFVVISPGRVRIRRKKT